MKNNNFNLIVLHHEEVFETRELALSYLIDYYKPNSLEGEPVIVKYGETRNPNVILAFGTSSVAPGGFYAIDMAKANEDIEYLMNSIGGDKEELDYVAEVLDGVVKSTGLKLDENKITDKVTYEPDPRDNVIGSAITIAEAIDLLSKYAQENFSEGELNVEDTKSVRLIYSVNPNGGKLLKAEIIVSSDGDTDELGFNDNIIGIKNDGIYATSHLAYDDVRHELIFTTSGYKNGRFQDDAVVQKVNLGQHTKLVADNEGNSVKLVIEEDPENYTATLSANLQIANRENNILHVSDGKAFVEGVARNIKYNDSNVGATLTELINKSNELDARVESAAKTAHVEGDVTDTLRTETSLLADGGAKVTGEVRLGSNNSIVVRNGGLEANISVDVNTSTNKLILTVGNDTITKSLPGVELIDNIEYDAANKNITIVYNENQRITIPVRDLIAEFNFRNDNNHDVELTTIPNDNGSTDVFAKTKISNSTDNLLTHLNGQLFVDEKVVDNKVTTETLRATQKETELQTAIDNLSNTTTDSVDALSDRLNDVRGSLTEETSRAIAAENAISSVAQHADEVAGETKANVTELTSQVNSLSTDLTTLEGNVEALSDTLTEARTNINTNAANITTLRSDLSDEITARTNKDTELDGKITNLNTNLTSETSRAETAENALDEKIDTLEVNVLARISHDIEDVEHLISVETARATEAEQANASAISDLTTEVNKKIESVEIVKNSQSDLQYILKVDGQDVSEINIPKDQFLNSVTYNPETKELTFVFETTTGTSTTVIRVDDLVDTYTAGNGLTLNNNEFAVRINEDSEAYLTVSAEGIKLFGIDAALAQKANDADLTVLSDKVDIINGNEATEGSIKNAIKVSKDYTDTNVTDLQTQINEVDTNITSLQTQVSTKANVSDVYTKAESDAKYLTQHQDISNLATKAELAENTAEIEELASTVDGMKFVTKETDTVRMTMVKETGAETRVLSSDVKIKTISGTENANIIKSDANGIYATVTMSYDKALNKITFNDGNGDKEFELNNFGILQDAYYDSVNKTIVLDVKKDDSSIEQIVIPVADLVNTWDVENSTNSPIVLTKTTGQEGDVLSANISILNNTHNLLVNQNGSLFVDDDANKHFALWGETETTVQAALNAIKVKTDKVDTIEANVANLRVDLTALQTQVSVNTGKIGDIEDNVEDLQTRLADFETRLTNAERDALEAKNMVTELKQYLGNIASDKTVAQRLEEIEDAIANLIDFGSYTQN